MSFGNPTVAANTADSKRSPSADTLSASTHSLRILLVDDNHINLSVLSTLLKRRFGHVLATSPVTLDSGLKALQLLRTEVFDLVFMDVEMPYLDGVECARRIRAGEDGVLEANRDVHIVAVTTNVGDEPEDLYRSVGMDGMIGKPVRFDQFQQYLSPLAVLALRARADISPICIDDRNVMPPLPPVGKRERVFFKPAIIPGAPLPKASRLDSQEGSDDGSFASMLKAQTRASLRDRRAMFLARTSTVSESRPSSFNDRRDKNDRQEKTERECIRKMASSNDRNETTFQALIDQEAMGPDPKSSGSSSALVARPRVYHRFSSPAYLLDASPVAKLKTDPAARSTPNLVRSTKTLTRPSIRPLIGAFRSRSRGSMESPTSSDSSSRQPSSGLFSGLTPIRRPSDAETVSSSLTTPQSSPDSDPFFEITPVELAGGAIFSPCEDDRPAADLFRVASDAHSKEHLRVHGAFKLDRKFGVATTHSVEAADLSGPPSAMLPPSTAACASW